MSSALRVPSSTYFPFSAIVLSLGIAERVSIYAGNCTARTGLRSQFGSCKTGEVGLNKTHPEVKEKKQAPTNEVIASSCAALVNNAKLAHRSFEPSFFILNSQENTSCTYSPRPPSQIAESSLGAPWSTRSEEHTSELQSRQY